MRLRLAVLTACAALALSLSARADIIGTFTATTAGNLTGTIVINTTTGVMVSENLSFGVMVSGPPPTGGGFHTDTFTSIATFTQNTHDFSYSVPDTTNTGSGSGVLNLHIKGTLIGYTGGSLCPNGDTGCDAASNFVYTRPVNMSNNNPFTFLLTGGTLVESSFIDTGGSPSPVPEPSSLALLTTGALALGGSLRRRFLHRA